MSMQTDIGAYIKGALAFAQGTATAAGAGDNSEVTGVTIDRNSYASPFHSAKLIVGVRATLASGATITVAANFQESANDSDWSDYGTTLTATTILTGASGGSTDLAGVAELDCNLASGLAGTGTGDPARRYIRVQVTPDMSATGTDTAEISGVVVLGGADVNPAA